MSRKKILVTGGQGQVGRSLQSLQCAADYEVACAPKSQLDITKPSSISQAFDALRPQLVINAAAYTAVDQAEQEQAAAFAVNRDGAENLARLCGESNIPLLHLSTDYVFDGGAGEPYREDARPAPVNVYGQSKWAGEKVVQSLCHQHIILRTSGIFGCHGKNFVKTIVALAREKRRLTVVSDQTVCPTPAPDIARACLAITQYIFNHAATQWGVYHYCSSDPVSWCDFAKAIVNARREIESLRVEEVCAIPTGAFPALAARPPYTALCCDKIATEFGIHSRSWRDGLKEVIKNLE